MLLVPWSIAATYTVLGDDELVDIILLWGSIFFRVLTRWCAAVELKLRRDEVDVENLRLLSIKCGR